MLDFVILSLAVYRLSVFFIYDDGPFDVFQRLRERVGILYYDNGDVIEESYKGFAYASAAFRGYNLFSKDRAHR